jgi:hypothetical protein
MKTAAYSAQPVGTRKFSAAVRLIELNGLNLDTRHGYASQVG